MNKRKSKFKEIICKSISTLGLIAILSPFGYIGYNLISRLSPTYEKGTIEHVYFNQSDDEKIRKLNWVNPFIWDETGNKIIGYRNGNSHSILYGAWGDIVSESMLDVIRDVGPKQKNYADVWLNGYGTLTKVRLHLKEGQEIPDYNSSRDGYIQDFIKRNL